jgi:hypothetical protein
MTAIIPHIIGCDVGDAERCQWLIDFTSTTADVSGNVVRTVKGSKERCIIGEQVAVAGFAKDGRPLRLNFNHFVFFEKTLAGEHKGVWSDWRPGWRL